VEWKHFAVAVRLGPVARVATRWRVLHGVANPTPVSDEAAALVLQRVAESAVRPWEMLWCRR